MKTCTVCRRTLPLAAFEKIGGKWHRGKCSPCNWLTVKKPRIASLPEERKAELRVRAAAKERARMENPVFRERARIQSQTRFAIEKGILTRGPCEVCGATPAEAHHDDYGKPLEVRWLCKPHHRQHHSKNAAAHLGGLMASTSSGE